MRSYLILKSKERLKFGPYLVWSGKTIYMKEYIKRNREENQSMGLIQPIMPLSFLNHNIGIILQS